MDAENTHDTQIAVLESQTSFLIPVLDSDNKNMGCLKLVINFLATHSGRICIHYRQRSHSRLLRRQYEFDSAVKGQ